jgi:class 3 adenylate cyclase/CHASE2 domain-containing sensor protein
MMSSGLMQTDTPKQPPLKPAGAAKPAELPYRKGIMESRERRRVAVFGLSLTLLIVIAELAGFWPLQRLDGALYDWRVQFCQRHLKPPTDQIVHINIDDAALERLAWDLGDWPWPRGALADIVTEVSNAKPKVIFLDLLLTGKRKKDGPELEASDSAATQPAAGTRLPGTAPTGAPAELSGDEQLSRALAAAGNVILPVSFSLKQEPRSELFQAMLDLFLAGPDLEITDDEMVNLIARQKRFDPPDRDQRVKRLFVDARAQAFDEVLESGDLDDHEKLKRKLFPRTVAAQAKLSATELTWDSPLYRLLEQRVDIARRNRALRLKFIPTPYGFSLPDSRIEIPPLLSLALSAKSFGSPEYVPDDGGGVARSVPLIVSHNGKLVPHVGLAIACAMLDVNLNTISVSKDGVLLTPPGRGPIYIPVHARVTQAHGRSEMLMDVPWFGKPDGWDTMYDYPAYRQTVNQIAIDEVWEICRTRQAAAHNRSSLRRRAVELLERIPEGYRHMLQITAAEAANPDRLAEALLSKDLTRLVQQIDADAARPQELDEPPPKGLAGLIAEEHRQLLKLHASLPKATALERKAASLLDDLRKQVEGKAVMLGWTATGQTEADIITTSLHRQKTPGIIGISTVCNGIMTGELWRRAPWWVNVLITSAIGAAMTACAVFLRPAPSLIVSSLLVLTYVLVNGDVLFDRNNTVVGLAGPLACALFVSLGTTTARYWLERSGRRFITKRLGGYVDTPLVEYVLSNPDQLRFDGEIRQLTIVYTDLAGFSALTEQLREKTVPLLNAYMGRMVPLVHQNKGYVDKFLGDGIMFFFGAPWRQEDHAIKAVQTVLEMHEALNAFNEESIERPALRMRAGISTGNVVVGDAGPEEACDYTVLGEAANLGARLQSANKLFGSRTLIGESTRELLEGRFLLRLLGRLRPTGLNETLKVYEPLCRAEAASDADRQLVRMTHDVVEPFMAGRFKDALEAVTRMEESHGESRFTKLYRRLCERYLREPAGAGFDGTIEQDDRD